MTDRKQPERRGLGRGLSALMADVSPDAASAETTAQPERQLPIEKLQGNPAQPRKLFSEADLDDLTRSIAAKGVLQPLIVRPHPTAADQFEIVAGERRWRAAQRARLHSVPVIVRDLSDDEMLEIAIIENIQRADLNPIEEANGYKQLMDRFSHTQEQMAQALGKSRSHIANLLRLLNLPELVQTHVREGRLSAGHARALVASDDPVLLSGKIIADQLSVRDTEALVKKGKAPKSPVKDLTKVEKDADTRALEADLSASLGMKVQIDHSEAKQSGSVTISYTSLEQLDAICQILSYPSRN